MTTPKPTHLSPEEFKAEISNRLWTYRDLAARWSVTENWLRRLAADPNRPTHWDDALRGLPLAETDALTTEHVRIAKRKLRTLPQAKPEKHKLTAQEAIKLLEKDIRALQSRGYTIKQITDHLTQLGLRIATSSLKNLLSRARKATAHDNDKKTATPTASKEH